MIIATHVATRRVLELLARLHEQAARRDLDGALAAVARPHEQAREAGAAVDRQRVQVVVEAREHRPLGAELGKVRGRRGEQVRRVLHAAAEGVGRQVEADGGHLRNVLHGVQQLLAPRVHDLRAAAKGWEWGQGRDAGSSGNDDEEDESVRRSSTSTTQARTDGSHQTSGLVMVSCYQQGNSARARSA
jgi:hypothetical protein